ncbi:hypothetical protein ACOMICROBIO_FLGHMIGD_02141 [Vibrio sp. B1FLJ16]|uniref:Flp family type IVb pilin n=1 Tax=Vibrio sp. B1FLJ16 TaxID=2751178 RepID=UPI0015F4CB4E|nr:hypothetical protein [Vibrio sp. B1FLJ16]CAD7810256.1 hypothetical protein ACOMICROBIO_FLGHMIGD_02141 [Vibrio sp. B1FLJ16]CAE6911821.1 hypothetical protein ACOMICROBIO_FLGHMIGD_02141 [Vibrio sp. B1FLJ16]
MNKFTQAVKNFWNDEEGLTLLEYILGAALIVSAMLTLDFWTKLATTFGDVSTKIQSKVS